MSIGPRAWKGQFSSEHSGRSFAPKMRFRMTEVKRLVEPRRKSLNRPMRLVIPAQVCTFRRRVFHMLRDLRQDPLIHRRDRFAGADVAASGVTVWLAVAVLKGSGTIRIFRAVDELLKEMHSVVEIPRIHVADGDVNLACQFRS